MPKLQAKYAFEMKRHTFSVIVGLVLPLLVTGCATKGPLKARSARPSAFLTHAREMRPDSARAPFDLVWRAPGFLEESNKYTAIYIAPVETRYLRPIDRPLMKALAGTPLSNRPVDETSMLLRKRFTEAFKKSPNPRLRVVDHPGPGVMTLQLALIELNPTNVVGNMARYGAPGGSALAPFNKGNIAIEGKLLDSVTGAELYEFADREQDKFAVVSLRDLSGYGHSRVAIGEWAKQFEELTRTPRTHKVAGSSAVTVNPF